MIKPPRLRPGDTVGVIAPGGAIHDPSVHETGVAVLEGLGYRVRLGSSVTARAGYLAGDDALRRDDLVEMFAAGDVRAIFCARGGYGVTRLLPLIDPATLARHAKIFVGYSDVSPLLVALVQHGGMVAFHGPMVAADFGGGMARYGAREASGEGARLDDESTRQMFALLGGDAHMPTPVARVIREGAAAGTLMGGCLSLLAATVGTPYAMRAGGAILFIEDVGEAAYRIDRMLTQLYQAGVFAGVRAVVFGSMMLCGGGAGSDRGVATIVAELADRLRVPIGMGLPSGHGRPNFTLPFGVEAEVVLEGGCGHLLIREPVVT